MKGCQRTQVPKSLRYCCQPPTITQMKRGKELQFPNPHYNKTRILFQHPLYYMSSIVINNELVKLLKSTFTHFMSKLTLGCHGSQVGQKFTWERTWERLRERAWLPIVEWSIWICQFKMSYVFGFSTEYSQKWPISFWIHNEMYIYIHNMPFLHT